MRLQNYASHSRARAFYIIQRKKYQQVRELTGKLITDANIISNVDNKLTLRLMNVNMSALNVHVEYAGTHTYSYSTSIVPFCNVFLLTLPRTLHLVYPPLESPCFPPKYSEFFH